MANLTSNEITGSLNSCKAYVQFYWNGSSAVIRTSYNVSSVSTFGTGLYGINYSSSLGTSSYTIAGSSRANYGYVAPNWAQYVSFYDLSGGATGMQVLDNGDQGAGFNEHTQFGCASVYV
jgi:hypothetical protein